MLGKNTKPAGEKGGVKDLPGGVKGKGSVIA